MIIKVGFLIIAFVSDFTRNHNNFNEKRLARFGRNIFDPREVPFAFTYLNNQYQFFQGSYLLQFDGNKSTALFDFKTDVFLKTNLLPALPDTVSKMETKLKAFIQQYNNRMVDNNLTGEGSQLKLMRPQQ